MPMRPVAQGHAEELVVVGGGCRYAGGGIAEIGGATPIGRAPASIVWMTPASVVGITSIVVGIVVGIVPTVSIPIPGVTTPAACHIEGVEEGRGRE